MREVPGKLGSGLVVFPDSRDHQHREHHGFGPLWPASLHPSLPVATRGGRGPISWCSCQNTRRDPTHKPQEDHETGPQCFWDLSHLLRALFLVMISATMVSSLLWDEAYSCCKRPDLLQSRGTPKPQKCILKSEKCHFRPPGKRAPKVN